MNRTKCARAASAIAIAMALGVCAPAGTFAQSRDFADLSSRLDRMQRDMDTLQRTVYQGRPPPPGAALPADTRVQADMQVRLDRMQSEIAAANGRSEEIAHQLALMRARLDKLAADMQARGPASPTAGEAAAAPAPARPSPGLGAPPRPLGTIPADAVPAGPPPPAPASEPKSAPAPAQVAALPPGTAKSQYEFATSFLAKQDYASAESALKAFVAAHPKDPLAGSAQFWIGETYFVRKDYQNAAFAYAEGIEKFPDGYKAPDSLLKLGMSLARLGKNDQACTALSRLKSSFPNASEVVKHRAAAEASRIKCKS